jgi:hypothetical protein
MVDQGYQAFMSKTLDVSDVSVQGSQDSSRKDQRAQEKERNPEVFLGEHEPVPRLQP